MLNWDPRPEPPTDSEFKVGDKVLYLYDGKEYEVEYVNPYAGDTNVWKLRLGRITGERSKSVVHIHSLDLVKKIVEDKEMDAEKNDLLNEFKKEVAKMDAEKNDSKDNVNHPAHYEGNIECIDAMSEVIGDEGVIHFCIGNAFKYIWRCKKKHESPVEDLKKARWYINKALELLEKESEVK